MTEVTKTDTAAHSDAAGATKPTTASTNDSAATLDNSTATKGVCPITDSSGGATEATTSSTATAVVPGNVTLAGAAVAQSGAAPTGTADDDGCMPEEEVTFGDWRTPQVELQEVKTVSGEEEEDVFWHHRAKLYRWAPDVEGTLMWKERGLGDAKLLQHKSTGKIRFLLRQEKTLKVAANHYVLKRGKLCQLIPNTGSEKIWVWSVHDSAEDTSQLEQFALKFGQVEQANIFKEKFEEACAVNAAKFDVTTPTASDSPLSNTSADSAQSPTA